MPFSTKSSTCMYRDVNNRIIITLQLLDNLWTQTYISDRPLFTFKALYTRGLIVRSTVDRIYPAFLIFFGLCSFFGNIAS